jgi:serine O-acetyltransferase
MISSKEDYIYYLESDKIALSVKGSWTDYVFNHVWKFEKYLRKVEYYQNCKKSFFWKPYIYFLKWRFDRLSFKMGFLIPPNVFGPGLSIPHYGTLLVNSGAQIGANCRIHNLVGIATKAGYTEKSAIIGNNVYIGVGAVIIGDVEIADNIVIGANAVVNKSFLEPGITIAGVPAKKISDKSSEGLLIRATEILDKTLIEKKIKSL